MALYCCTSLWWMSSIIRVLRIYHRIYDGINWKISYLKINSLIKFLFLGPALATCFQGQRDCLLDDSSYVSPNNSLPLFWKWIVCFSTLYFIETDLSHTFSLLCLFCLLPQTSIGLSFILTTPSISSLQVIVTKTIQSDWKIFALESW